MKFIILVVIDGLYIWKLITMMKNNELRCHRRNGRCYKWQQGKRWRICSRCFCMYVGTTLFPIIYLLEAYLNISRINIFIIAVALMIPVLIDGFTQLQTKRMSNNLLRSITGLLAGLGLGITIVLIINLGGY